MPIHVLILVCALQTQPSACTAETAIDVTQGPRVANELRCGKMGQAVLAGTALAPRAGVEYVKISCVRDEADHARSSVPEKTTERTPG